MFNLRDNELDFPRDIPRLVYLGARSGMALPGLIRNNARDIYSQYRASNPSNPSLRGSLLNTMSSSSSSDSYYEHNRGGAGGGGKMSRTQPYRLPKKFRSSISRAHGLSKYGSMSKRKLKMRARGNALKPRIKELLEQLEPKVLLEEHFMATTASGKASAEPLTAGNIGKSMSQLMVPTSVLNIFPAPTTIGSQLVQEQSFYPFAEQLRLYVSATRNYTLFPPTISDPFNSNNIWNNNFTFNFGGATCYHTFLNTGKTQCNFELWEWKPRRHLDAALTPIQLWNRDIGGTISAPVNEAVSNPKDDTILRDYRVLGQRPNKKLCPSLFYAYTCLSVRKFSLQPGEECKYKQIFPPYVVKSEFMRIASGLTTTTTEYNTHTRFLMLIGYGEKSVFSDTVLGTSVLSNSSWQMGHQQMRKSSFRCTVPGKKIQRVVVDSDNTAIAFNKETVQRKLILLIILSLEVLVLLSRCISHF